MTESIIKVKNAHNRNKKWGKFSTLQYVKKNMKHTEQIMLYKFFSCQYCNRDFTRLTKLVVGMECEDWNFWGKFLFDFLIYYTFSFLKIYSVSGYWHQSSYPLFSL